MVLVPYKSHGNQKENRINLRASQGISIGAYWSHICVQLEDVGRFLVDPWLMSFSQSHGLVAKASLRLPLCGRACPIKMCREDPNSGESRQICAWVCLLIEPLRDSV